MRRWLVVDLLLSAMTRCREAAKCYAFHTHGLVQLTQPLPKKLTDHKRFLVALVVGAQPRTRFALEAAWTSYMSN